MDADVDQLVAILSDPRQSERVKRLLLRGLVREESEQVEDLILALAANARKPKKPAPPTVVHLRGQDEVSVCGRNYFNLDDDWSRVTCLWCDRAVRRPPKEPQLSYHRNDFAERNAEMVRRVQAGETLEAIGQEAGVTRERVRQIAQTQGVIPREIQAAERERKEQARRAEYERTHTRTCAVCQQTYVGTRLTCDDADCRYVYKVGRAYLFPERYETQRRSNAAHILKRENVTAGNRAWAEKVLAGERPPPKRRYIIPESKIGQALQRIQARTGVNLIPGLPERNRTENKLTYRCRATNLNGTPCRRGVAQEGGLCINHRRAYKHTF